MATAAHDRPVYLSGIAHELGAQKLLTEIDDAGVHEQLDVLREQGLRHCRVADESVVELAARSARRTLATIPPDSVDAVVFCTDTSPEVSPTTEIWDFLEAVGLPRTPATFVSGSGCGNLGPTLGVARGMLLSGDRSTVLLVTADRVRSQTRYLANSQSVLSDGAASCVLSTVSFGAGFEVRAQADSCRADIDAATANPVLVASAMTRGIRTVVRSVTKRLSLSTNDFRYMITGNYGRSSVEFLATSAGVPVERVPNPLRAGNGHCFAADEIMTMESLVDSVDIAEDDQVLLLTTSPRSWSAVAVRHVAAGGSDG